jgi:hypothetical protein
LRKEGATPNSHSCILLLEETFCSQRLREHTHGENDKIPYFPDDAENADSTHKLPACYFQYEAFQDEVLHSEAFHSETFCFLCSTWHVNIK